MTENYIIIDGPKTVYPIIWFNCYNDYITKEYNNYKNIIRENQPFLILTNPIYKKLDDIAEEDFFSDKIPLNYFINKSIENLNLTYLNFLEIEIM